MSESLPRPVTLRPRDVANWQPSCRLTETRKQSVDCLDGGLPPMPPMLTLRQTAAYWGVSKDKVLDWINAGSLQAIDVRSSDSSRPQYRIPREAIDAFNAARCNVKSPGKTKEMGLGRRASRPSPKFEYFR
jgi:excisionase family DNA binding protein